MKIADKTVVTIHYTLSNSDGETLESSREVNEPLAYLHGASNIIPGLEKALEGHEVGANLDVAVPPAEGYGERNEALSESVPKEMFGGVEEIEVGMRFHAQTQEGEPYVVTITEVEGDMVKVDGNHPFAGETLHFSVEVVEIREASAEELEHGHVHGPGGHDH